MKKNDMRFILTFLVTGIFCACNDATPPEPVIPPVECVIPSETRTINCTETPAIFEIEPNVKNVSVHFSDAVSSSEKEIYLTVTNPTETAFDGIYTRTVIEASSNVNTNTVEARTASSGEDFFEAENFCGSRKADECLSDSIISCEDARSAQYSSREDIDRTQEQLDLKVNETKKTLYVDHANLTAFTEKQATLRFVGNFCNVWVIDENWTSGEPSSEAKTVNADIVKKLAGFFDDIHLLETKLYGEESNLMFYTDQVISSTSDFDTVHITKLSNTGTKVNLVVLDICVDDVLGYFSRKDYFPNLTDLNTMTGGNYTEESYIYYGSNEGKYLYIDAESCVEDIANLMTIVTHEYQHLINFGRKTMDKHKKGTPLKLGKSDLNETAAMVCEDFLKEYTKSHYSADGFCDEHTPFIYRLPFFNVYFSNSGIEYRTEYELYSYPTLYTFGAWCARKYGGAELMRDITNSEDTELFPAMINSIKRTSGQTVTAEELMRDFVYDCVVPDSVSEKNAFMNAVTLSKGDRLYNETKDYGYPLTSINLWDLTDYCASKETLSKLDKGLHGPVYGKFRQYLKEARPYGFFMNKVGTVPTAESFTLTLAAKSGYSALQAKTYLIIQ